MIVDVGQPVPSVDVLDAPRSADIAQTLAAYEIPSYRVTVQVSWWFGVRLVPVMHQGKPVWHQGKPVWVARVE